MASRSWFTTGKGFYTANVNEMNLVKFVRDKAAALGKDLRIDFAAVIDRMESDSFFSLNVEFDDMLPVDIYNAFKGALDITNYTNLRDILLGFVSDIMQDETKIWFIYAMGMDGCIGEGGAILLKSSMPWEFTSRERFLEEGEFLDICREYMEALGVSEDDLGDIEVEYFS